MMGLLWSIDLPHWLMIGGVGLIAMGFLGLAFIRGEEVTPKHESLPEQRPKMPPLPKLLDSSRRKRDG
jgi:hypothetical protein